MAYPAPSKSAPLRAAAALGLLMGGLAGSGRALASPKLQGVGETSVGYTDNIQSAPSVPMPGGAPKTDGAFVVLSPALVLASASWRAIHRLKYTYTYDLFFQQTAASTSSNQLEYRAFFDLAPRVALIAGGSAIQSNRYASIFLTPPGAGAINATPTGSGSFLAASADELISFDVAPGLRAYEGAGITEQTPLFDTVAPRTFAPVGRLGIEQAFVADSMGAEARADYSIVEGSLSPDGRALGVQTQIVATGVGVWRHDWGRDFTSRLEAGALRLERLNTGTGFWEPAGRASLIYVTPLGDAELSYAHAVTTNPLLGQTLLFDEARLRGAVPLTKKGEVLAATSAGYQAGRLLDENAALAAHVDAILVDVGVGWKVTELVLLG